MYKVSQFTVTELIDYNKLLVYNMLTQSYFVIDAAYSANWAEVVDKDLLLSGKFLVDEKLDEKKYLLDRFNEINNSKRVLDIVLTITTQCEMRCVYCYEEGIVAQTMSGDVLDKVLRWIKQYIENQKMDSIHILLFGGEPLYDIESLKNVVNKLTRTIAVPVTFSLASNGFNMQKEYIKWLIERGLVSVQIPLDGPQQIHDLRRPLKYNDGVKKNFEIILDNIRDIVDLPIEICIKINIDKHNYEYIKELLEILLESDLREKFVLKFEAIALTPSSHEDQSHFCNVSAFESRSPEMSIAYHHCMELARDMGFVVSPTIGNITPCMYSAKHKYVVDCEGALYKCISAVGMPTFQVGMVESFEFSSATYQCAIERVEIAKKCLEMGCPYVPKCGGGCAYEAYLKDGDKSAIDCKKAYFKDYFKRKFILEYRRSNRQ